MTTRISASKAVFRKKSSDNVLGYALLGACVLASAFIVSGKRKLPSAPPIIQPIVTDFDSLQVMVPVEPVAAGVKIKDIKLKRVSFPRHQIPEEAIVNLEPFLESVVIATLPANLPLFPANLSLLGHIANPVLDKIPFGMRAMTIRVDATSAVEGWAGSGSVVDILLVEKNRTSVVAEKVKILSAERSVAPVEGRASPTVPSTVTLLVTQEQCLGINTAIPLGKIAFALRSSRDEESWSDTEFNSAELMSKQVFDGKSSTIRGVISFKGEDAKKSFALTDGKWIKTEVMPEGFFINGGN